MYDQEYRLQESTNQLYSYFYFSFLFLDRQKNEERKVSVDEVSRVDKDKDRKRKSIGLAKDEQNKKPRTDAASNSEISSYVDSSEKNSPSPSVEQNDSITNNDSSNENEAVVVDCDSPSNSSSQGLYIGLEWKSLRPCGFIIDIYPFSPLPLATVLFSLDDLGARRRRHPGRGAKRGRPRGSRRGGGSGSLGRHDTIRASGNSDS